MFTDAQQQYVDAITRTLQVIVTLLASGVFAFAAAVTFLGAQQPPAEPFLTYVAAGCAILAIVMWGVVPGILVSRGRQAIVAGQPLQLKTKPPGAEQAGDVGSLANVYLLRTIVAVAILRGGAFFNLVAYLLEGRVLSLIVAGILWVMILMHVPGSNKLADWTQSELATIEQLRQMQTYDGR
jgi:hypothetical protein